MSTLTQSSLNEAINNLRQETEKSINDLRKELKMEVTNMESSIASAVIKAINANSPNNMEVDQSESASTDSSHTTTTTKSMMDRLDSLTQIVQLLAEKVQDIADIQEENANKRARSLEPTSRKILQSPNRQNYLCLQMGSLNRQGPRREVNVAFGGPPSREITTTKEKRKNNYQRSAD
jgi:hypothetical protein